MTPHAVLVSRDVMVISQVTGTAAELGYRMVAVSTVEDLRQALAEGSVHGVVLDLSCGLAPGDVRAVLPAGPVLHTVAYGPHVHTEALSAARDAGWETVLPRSQFSARLAEILLRVCQPRPTVM